MNEFRSDHSVPVFVTLLVVAFLLMTFDVRAEGGGSLASLRSIAGTVVQPLESAAGAVVDPLGDFASGVSNIAGLRSENEALRALLAQKEAELATVGEELERLSTLERMLGLQLAVEDLSGTNANVTGRNDSFDLSFRIDKGTDQGVLPDQPVVDENGYLVGRVLDAWGGGATVVPITADVAAVTVTVGGQDGILESVPGAGVLELDRQMSLDVFETARDVSEGDRVVTSQFSGAFPPGIPVGEIAADAEPAGQSLSARVTPFFDLAALRVVRVLVWPPDAGAASADDEPDVPEGPAGGIADQAVGGADDTDATDGTDAAGDSEGDDAGAETG